MTESSQPQQNQAPEKINFQGRDYAIDRMSDQSKYLVDQMVDVSRQLQAHNFKLDQLKAMQAQFNAALETSLKEDLAAGSDESEVEDAVLETQ